MINSSDLYYTAGLLDGEGTITISKNRKSAKFRHPQISIASTTLELLKYLQNTFGGYISSKKIYAPHHKQSWHWQVHGTHALVFAALIAPYLKEPEKKRRAELLTSQYKKVTPRNGKYTNIMLSKKLEFEQNFLYPSTP